MKTYIKSKAKCTPRRVWSTLLERIPILSWLPKYNIRKNLPGDIISGFTVAIMHIPQGTFCNMA